MAFDPDAYLSGGTAVKEFDPDAYLAGDTELPEVVATQTEGGGGFLEKINAALRKPSPAWLQAPESAARELVTEMVPHDLPSYLKSILGPAGTAFETGQALAQGDVRGIPLVGRVPEIMAADETPAFSKERYKTALKTLMDVGALAGAVEGPRIPLRAKPTLAERITQPRVEPVVEEPLAPVTPEVPLEPPVQAPEMPAPEAVVPGPVAGEVKPQGWTDERWQIFQKQRQAAIEAQQLREAEYVPAPPAPAPVSPGAAKQLGKLKAYVEKSKKLGQQVDPKVEAKIAEIEGVSSEPPLAPEMMMPEQADTYFRREGLRGYRVMEEHKKAIQSAIEEGKPYNQESASFHRLSPEAPVQAQEAPPLASEAPGGVPVAETPAGTAEPPPPGAGAPTGKVVAAAVRDDLGNVYTGTTHGTAADAALAAGARLPKVRKGELGLQIADQGFVTDKGEYLTNEEAYRRALENKQIKPQNAPLLEAYTFNKQQAAKPPAPPEVPPSERGYAGMEPLPTSTKNVVTAAEREARELPPAEEAAARDFGTVWDESAKDTAAPARLVAALKVEPRALSDVENAHLLRRQIELQTEHEVTTKAVNEATDPAVAAEAKQRLETVRNDLQDVYDVGKAAGTETGRGLNARKMLADQDYALANMEATTRALVNDGKPLSEAQLSEVAKLHERIRTAEDKLAAYESQEIFNQSLKAAPRRPVLSFLDEQAVKARERINARKTRLYADPLGITNVAHLADEAIIGASHIARGVTKFADWSAQMVSEFGDRIKPYLAALFEKSKQQFKNASAGLKKTPMTYAEREARALAGEKKGIITRTEKLKGRTEVVTAEHPFGEFEPLKRRPPRMDPEKAQLQYEYSKAKEAFDRGIYEAELKKRSVPERILGTAREVLNMPRSLLASADFSAVRRQGGIYTMIHPLRARHAFRAMMEATKSEQGYFKVMQEIRDRPNAPEYQRYGLELTDIGPMTRAKMEEQFQSRWAGKIPGISHSQRAYTGFLNRARADWFDLLKDTLAKKGEPLTPKQGKAIANAVNVFTGRGAMNQKWIGAMTALNDVFFAPRWRASRFQTLIGQPLWKNSGARGVIAKEYAKALIGYGSILTLIGWATKNTLHPMEKNPVSTEAGKLRVGNTRIDFLQGLQQPTVLLSRLFSGRTKTAAGNVEKIYGDVPLGKTTSSDIITRFLRSSLAPVPGGVWNVLEGKNVIGEPVTLPSTVRDLTIPLLGKDIYDAMKEQGVPTGTALGLIALFGDGIQTYSPRVSQKAPKREPTVSQRIKAAKAKRTRERKKEREE